MKKYILVCTAYLVAVPMMYGQQKKDSVTMEEIHLNDIIIQGDFYTDPTFSIVYNQQDLQPTQPKNVADLFRNIEGMNFIKRGNYAIDPSFRASQYEQLNVQYDGGVKAMHACPNRMDPVTTHVLPEEVEKIEIIKGPYAVRYGANFGGVINMVTSKPAMNGEGFSGDVKGGFESNGGTYVLATGLQYAGTKFHLKGNVGYRDFGNYKDGNGTEVPSSFKSTDYVLGAGYSPNHKNHLMVQWRQSFGRDVLHAGLPMDTETDDSSIFSFDYYLNHLDGVLNQVNVKAYYATVDHLMNNKLRPNFKMADMSSHVFADTYGGKIETKWIPSTTWNLFTGLDYLGISREGTKTMLKKIDSQGNVIANPMPMEGDVWQDGIIQDLGVFADANFNLSDKFVLKSGLRVDFVQGEAKNFATNFTNIYGDNAENNDTNLSGYVGLKYEAKPKQVWELALGRGVRSANMTERYINYFNVGQDLFSYVGNPTLKPEVNHQIELGYKNISFVEDIESLQFDYGFSIYHAFLNDYITAVQSDELVNMMNPKVKRFINIDKATKTGFEFFINTHWNRHWTVGSSVSYVYTENKELNESLPLTPPFTAKFNIDYQNNQWVTSLRFTAVNKQDNIAESFAEVETAGYGVLDFDVVYKPIPNWSIGMSVLNILDKAYHNHQNFNFINQTDFTRVPVNEPGRNFTIFTRYSF